MHGVTRCQTQLNNTNTALLEFTFSELEPHIPPLPLRAIVPTASASELWHHLAPSMSTLMATKSNHSLCMRAKPLQSHLTLWDLLDCSLQGSSVHGILQARILEWVVMPSFRRSSQQRDRTRSFMSPALAWGFFTTSATWETLLLVYPVIWMLTKVFAID